MSDTNLTQRINLILQDPKFVELAVNVMNMEQDYNEDYLVPFEPDETDEDNEDVCIVKQMKGDYGKTISYIPVKYIRKRLDLAFNKKWSFFILAEYKETEPFDRYSKEEGDYVAGSNYLKCVGLMLVPGFGIRMEYGVKKVRGDSESADWKACKTDALKKCAEAFGIYLDYEDEDAEDNSSGGKGSGGKSVENIDDLEYTDEDLEDAFSTKITFGRNKGLTMQEIMEDDPSYIEWLAENANDDDVRWYAQVIQKYTNDQEAEESSRKNRKGKGASTSNKGNKGGRESSGRNSGGSSRNSSSKSGGNKGSSRSSKNEDDDSAKDNLIELCRAELDNLDRVQARSMMASVSISSKFPKGKTKLEQFTLSELRELAEVLEVEE